jgi:hypothetical protein
MVMNGSKIRSLHCARLIGGRFFSSSLMSEEQRFCDTFKYVHACNTFDFSAEFESFRRRLPTMTAKRKLQESGHCFTKRNVLNSMSTEEKMDVDETVAEKVAAPQPSASAESASKYPDMALAQKIHKATVAVALVDAAEAQRVGIVDTLQDTVMTEISQELENPSLYRHLQSILPYDGLTDADLAVLDEKHAKHVKELEVKVEEAKESAGDMEVLDARLEIARFAAKSLSKEEAIDAYEKVLQLPKLSTGKQIDALMEESRVASFYGDTKKNAELIEKV